MKDSGNFKRDDTFFVFVFLLTLNASVLFPSLFSWAHDFYGYRRDFERDDLKRPRCTKSCTLGKCRIIENRLCFTENVNNAMKMDKYANARQLLHVSNYTDGLNVKRYISYVCPGQFKHQRCSSALTFAWIWKNILLILQHVCAKVCHKTALWQ